jgi:Tol biopolymer transport system component
VAGLPLPWSGGAVHGRAGFLSATRGDGLIAFTSSRTGDGEVFAMNPDGSDQINLSNDPRHEDSSPSWSSDGTRIAFVSDRTGDPDIWTMGADGSAATDVSGHAGTDESPAWAPDGSRIAFSSNRTGTFEVWIMDADGTGLSQFTAGPSDNVNPAWSPDGTRLLWTSDRSGDREIFGAPADGSGRPVDLSSDPGHADDGAAWSPDGAAIAFDSDRTGRRHVWLMNADGTGQTDLTSRIAGDAFDPVFAPDEGSRIAYALSGPAKTAQIALSNVTPTKGTYGNPVTVSGDPASASQPSWQPLPAAPPNGSPIRHIVVVFQENHSFDNVLGVLCVDDSRCDGATSGELHDGTVIPLRRASDLVPDVRHSPGPRRLRLPAAS